jgi:hypothetical protein
MEERELICTIDGKDIYTEDEHLTAIVDSLNYHSPSTEYLDVDGCDSLNVLINALDELSYHSEKIQNLMEDISNRIKEITGDDDSDDEQENENN